MKEERVEADETLINFDITSLFTNVPTDEAVKVIHRKLMEEEDPTITTEDCSSV